jgi:AmmeMemoRadiSam system protein A
MVDKLTSGEQQILLSMARQALVDGVEGKTLEPLTLNELPKSLVDQGATFVTLTKRGALRGCVGALEAYQPLAEDVREHAVAAALQDYRFPPVSPDEVPELKIEISRLTTPEGLEYQGADNLLGQLRPGIDGVILRDGFRRATFLPQVWDKIPDPAEFMNHLCQKMGVDANSWRYRQLEVLIYQVEEFHE